VVFFSTQDADTDGEEGKYFVWTHAEVSRALGDKAKNFCNAYNVSPSGYWEGKNILYRAEENKGQEFLGEREKLFQLRSQRRTPHRDEKILVSWNGMMIEALAFAYQVTQEEKYLLRAQKAAHTILNELKDGRGLVHSSKDGKHQGKAFLDDYGAFILGLVRLFESDYDERWIIHAKRLAELTLDGFWDEKSQSFFYNSADHETLIVRPREFYDGALPSATGLIIEALIRLGKITGEIRYLETAEKTLQTFSKLMTEAPRAAGQLLVSLHYLNSKSPELVVFSGKETAEVQKLFHKIRSKFLPTLVAYCATEGMGAIFPLLKGKAAKQGQTTAYLCEGFVCQKPVEGLEAVAKMMEELA